MATLKDEESPEKSFVRRLLESSPLQYSEEKGGYPVNEKNSEIDKGENSGAVGPEKLLPDEGKIDDENSLDETIPQQRNEGKKPNLKSSKNITIETMDESAKNNKPLPVRIREKREDMEREVNNDYLMETEEFKKDAEKLIANFREVDEKIKNFVLTERAFLENGVPVQKEVRENLIPILQSISRSISNPDRMRDLSVFGELIGAPTDQSRMLKEGNNRFVDTVIVDDHTVIEGGGHFDRVSSLPDEGSRAPESAAVGGIHRIEEGEPVGQKSGIEATLSGELGPEARMDDGMELESDDLSSMFGSDSQYEDAGSGDELPHRMIAVPVDAIGDTEEPYSPADEDSSHEAMTIYSYEANGTGDNPDINAISDLPILTEEIDSELIMSTEKEDTNGGGRSNEEDWTKSVGVPFQLNIDSDAHGEQVESMHENRDSDIILGKNESKAGNAPNEKKAKASIFDLLPDSSDGGPVILEGLSI